jgi:hypothetical protein
VTPSQPGRVLGSPHDWRCTGRCLVNPTAKCGGAGPNTARPILHTDLRTHRAGVHDSAGPPDVFALRCGLSADRFELAREREKERGDVRKQKGRERDRRRSISPWRVFVGSKVHDGACNPGPVTRQHVGLGKCPSRGEGSGPLSNLVALQRTSSFFANAPVFTMSTQGRKDVTQKRRCKDQSERMFGSFPRP